MLIYTQDKQLKLEMKRVSLPWMIFSLIAFFMLLDLGFIALAQKTFSGVYTDNYYQKGVDFDKINRQGIYQDEIGWKSEIMYNEDSRQVSLRLRDANGRALAGAKVQAKVMRPVTNKFDHLLDMTELSSGLYGAKVDFLENGQWEIRVKAQFNGQEYINSRRFMVGRE